MSGDAKCSICERLHQLEREHEIALRRLDEIRSGAAIQPRVHAGAAFYEIKELRKVNQ